MTRPIAPTANYVLVLAYTDLSTNGLLAVIIATVLLVCRYSNRLTAAPRYYEHQIGWLDGLGYWAEMS